MLPPERPGRIYVAFDDHRLVANTGLLLPTTLTQHLGLGELVNRHVDLGDMPGRANAGDKMPTTKTLRRRFFSLPGRSTRKARRLKLHLPRDGPSKTSFSSALARLRALPLPS